MGPGTGDAVSDGVDYDPWLTETSSCTLPIGADFTADITGGVEDLAVHFADRSTSPEGVVAWRWDFDGNGIIDSTAQNPTFVYTEPGVYTVVLTAHEADGDYDIEKKGVYITVNKSVPTSDFSAIPLAGPGPLTVDFTNQSTSLGSDKIVLWQWDFDNDGNIDKTEENPSWTYTVGGLYTVTLTVTDEDGDSDTRVKENYIAVTILDSGDLDGDSDVDKNDLNILLSHRNKPASACPACDLDGDGMITVLDARNLVLLCTRPSCVCE